MAGNFEKKLQIYIKWPENYLSLFLQLPRISHDKIQSDKRLQYEELSHSSKYHLFKILHEKAISHFTYNFVNNSNF